MSENLDDVQVDVEYRSPNAPHQSTEISTNKKKGCCANFLEKTSNILTDPVFIEILVVVMVIGGSVLSSELAIYAGKSYSGSWL